MNASEPIRPQLDNHLKTTKQINSKRKRAVVGVITQGGKLLAIRRSQNVIAPGKICFPGGGIENGESDQAALVREITEEIGVAAAPVRKIWESTTPWGVQVHWWLATIPNEITFSPNAEEVEWVGWMTFDEMSSSKDLLVSNKQFFAALANEEFELS